MGANAERAALVARGRPKEYRRREAADMPIFRVQITSECWNGAPNGGAATGWLSEVRRHGLGDERG